ncbi:MAG: hypothetical protein ACSHYB_05945 [Roseibacillus sp.]
MKPKLFFPSTLVAFSVLGLAFAAANPVDFTTGFTVDTPLDGQNDWVTDGGVTVNSAGATDNGFNFGILTSASESLTKGGSVTSTIQFTYSVNPDVNSTSPLLNVGFFNNSDPALATGGDAAVHDRLNASVVRIGDGLRIRLYQNWGNRSPAENGVDNTFAQTGGSSGIDTGLDSNGADPMSIDGDEDLDSDVLELSLTLTAGDDVDSWTAVATLRNVTSDFLIHTHTRTNLSFDALGTALYGGIGFGQGDGNTQTTSRTISDFSFVSTPLASATESVGFIESENYFDGNLNANGDWSSDGDTLSDAAGTGIVTLDGFDDHIYQPLTGLHIDGATYQASIDFTFTDDATYTPPLAPGDPITDVNPANKPILNVAIFNQGSSNSTSAGFAISFADLTSNVVTIDTTTDHGFAAGQSVFVKDVDFLTTDPNGTVVVTSVPTTTSFTYALTGADEVYTLDGNSYAFDPSTATPQLRASIGRVGGDSYRVQLQSGWNRFATNVNPLPFVGGVEQAVGALQGAPIPALDLGVDRTAAVPAAGDLTSDNLRLNLTLAAGATNNTWEATIELFNLDSATPSVPIATEVYPDLTSFTAEELYGGFGAGQSDNNVKISNRDVDNFSFAVTYPTTSQPVDIEITSCSFDGSNFTVNFTGAASSDFKLTSSPDLVTSFGDTGETTTTDGSGVGSFSYAVTGSPTESFFRVEAN